MKTSLYFVLSIMMLLATAATGQTTLRIQTGTQTQTTNKDTKGTKDSRTKTNTKTTQTTTTVPVYTTMSIESLNFEDNSNSAQGSRSTSDNISGYRITRTADQNSNFLASAASTGIAYSNARITHQNPNGTVTTYNFTNIHIGSYSTSINNGATVESFIIAFQSEQVNTQ